MGCILLNTADVRLDQTIATLIPARDQEYCARRNALG